MTIKPNPTSPSTVKNASAPCDSTTTTCPPCCCCVTSVSIGNIRPFFGTIFNDPNDGTPYINGHAFDFVMNFSFATGSGGCSDCTFEWWEKVNLPAISGHPPNTWTNMMTIAANSPTFYPWAKRTIPCPGGGSLTVTITDIPSLGNPPGSTQTRTLECRLVAKSGSGCGSGTTSATATATQVLVMVTGTLEASASSFTIGPSSTTP